MQLQVYIATTTNNAKGTAIIMVTGSDTAKGARFYVLAPVHVMRGTCTSEGATFSPALVHIPVFTIPGTYNAAPDLSNVQSHAWPCTGHAWIEMAMQGHARRAVEICCVKLFLFCTIRYAFLLNRTVLLSYIYIYLWDLLKKDLLYDSNCRTHRVVTSSRDVAT